MERMDLYNNRLFITAVMIILISGIMTGGLPVVSLADENIGNSHITGSVKVFFLGSSYFRMNNLADMVKNFADMSGKDISIYDCNRSGYLEDMISGSYFTEKINLQKWDYVVLQGTCSKAAFHSTELTNTLNTIIETVKANHSSTKVVFCLPWAYEDGLTWVQGRTETYFDLQKILYDNTLSISNRLKDLSLAPIGWTWNTVMKEKPGIKLFQSDYNHPSFKGSYLMACAIYCTIFQDRLDVDTDYSGVSNLEEFYFQKTASDVVLNDLELWKLNTSTSVEEKTNKSPSGFDLKQNYPNPFNPETTIEFRLQKQSYIVLQILDTGGKLVKSMVNENKSPGTHRTVWNGMNDSGKPVSSGIYFYRITSEDISETGKMALLR